MSQERLKKVCCAKCKTQSCPKSTDNNCKPCVLLDRRNKGKECFACVYSLKFVEGVATLCHIMPENLPKLRCCNCCTSTKRKTAPKTVPKTVSKKEPRDKTTQFPDGKREYNIHETETLEVEVTKPGGEKEIMVTKTESLTKFTKDSNTNQEIKTVESTTKFKKHKVPKRRSTVSKVDSGGIKIKVKDRVVPKSRLSDKVSKPVSSKVRESERSVIMKDLNLNLKKTNRGHGGGTSASDSKTPDDKDFSSEENIETLVSVTRSEDEPTQDKKDSGRNSPQKKSTSDPPKKDNSGVIRRRNRLNRIEVVGGGSISPEVLDKLTKKPDKVSPESSSTLETVDDKRGKETVSNTRLQRTHGRSKKAKVHSDQDGTIKSEYTVLSYSDEEEVEEQKEEPKVKKYKKVKKLEEKPSKPEPIENPDQKSCNCCRMSPGCPCPHKQNCNLMYPIRFTCGCKAFLCYPNGQDCKMNCCYRNPRHP